MKEELWHLSPLKALLEENGLKAKRTLGQNFLFHRRECQKITEAAGIEAGDRVLEIGPGLGHLTAALEEAGALVTACEIDKRLTDLWPELHPEFQGRLINADFLKLPPEEYEECGKVAANLPYYAVKEILMKLLTCGVKWRSLTFTLQKEEVQRLAKKPGKERYGALNALLLILGETRCAGLVIKDNFYPRPNVDSAVFQAGPLTWPEYSLWLKTVAIVKAAFARRRKLLRSNLETFKIPPAYFEKAGIPPLARAEEIAPGKFLELARLLPE